MTLALIAVLVGFIALVWSADQFVNGAGATARYLGMSPLMIGLTVVAFGTSAPEILVSINAALNNASDMAVGNALGSNLANVGLVLAITCFLAPIPIVRGVRRRELPILACITLLAGYVLMDFEVDLIDGILLLSSLIIGGIISVRGQKSEVSEEDLDLDGLEMSQTKAMLLLIFGLLLLVASSRLLVWGAKEVAELMGVSQLIIGLTLVAVGTSLPELAASVACALKGQVDIALGNIVGSNIFNIAAVMSVPGLMGGVMLEPEVLTRDYLFMAGITFILIGVIAVDAYQQRKSKAASAPAQAEAIGHDTVHMGKVAGLIFLMIYIAYYVRLFAST